MMTDKDKQRFWNNVEIGDKDECWLWTKGKDGNGYGSVWVQGKNKGAHRVSWILAFGPIPKGLCVCHHCDNRGCVNPNHLFLGTKADNNADMDHKGRRGTTPGESNASSKLTEQQVLEISRLRHEKGLTQRVIAEKFGVTRSMIGYITRGVYWAGLGAPQS